MKTQTENMETHKDNMETHTENLETPTENIVKNTEVDAQTSETKPMKRKIDTVNTQLKNRKDTMETLGNVP